MGPLLPLQYGHGGRPVLSLSLVASVPIANRIQFSKSCSHLAYLAAPLNLIWKRGRTQQARLGPSCSAPINFGANSPPLRLRMSEHAKTSKTLLLGSTSENGKRCWQTRCGCDHKRGYRKRNMQRKKAIVAPPWKENAEKAMKGEWRLFPIVTIASGSAQQTPAIYQNRVHAPRAVIIGIK